MTPGGSTSAEGRRRRAQILDVLADFPRQYAALEHAMATFGEDFELSEFKAAFETEDDLEAYNRVQSVERALGRVQNFVAELAEAGARVADLPRASGEHGSSAALAFASLREAQVVSPALARRLVRAQGARSRIEHAYVRIPAGDVHAAAQLVHESSRAFIGPYRRWIEPYLRTPR